MTDAELRRQLLARYHASGERAFLEAARKLTLAGPTDLRGFLLERRAARRGPKVKVVTPRELDVRLLRMAAEIECDPRLRVWPAARREVARHGHSPFAGTETATQTLAREFGRKKASWLATLRWLRELEARFTSPTATTDSSKTGVGEADGTAATQSAAGARKIAPRSTVDGSGKKRTTSAG